MENNIRALEMSALLADMQEGRQNIVAAIAAATMHLRKAGLEAREEAASAEAAKSAEAVAAGRPRPLEGLPILGDPADPYVEELTKAGAIVLGPASPAGATAVADGIVALALGQYTPDDIAQHGLTGLWRRGHALVARSAGDIVSILRPVAALKSGASILRIGTVDDKGGDRAHRSALRLAGDLLRGLHYKVGMHNVEGKAEDLNEQEALLAAVDVLLLPSAQPQPTLPTILLPAGYAEGGGAVLVRMVARPGNSEGLLHLAGELARSLGWKRPR